MNEQAKRWIWRAFAVATAAGLSGACGGGAVRGATPHALSAAGQRFEQGETVFIKECAGCHGRAGQGAEDVPQILGKNALSGRRGRIERSLSQTAPESRLSAASFSQPPPEYYEGMKVFPTADALFGYVSKNMPLPEKRAGSLSEAEYWAVVSYMLAVQGADVPQGGVGPGNAQRVRVP